MVDLRVNIPIVCLSQGLTPKRQSGSTLNSEKTHTGTGRFLDCTRLSLVTKYTHTVWAYQYVATIHEFPINSIEQLRILLNSESEVKIIQNSRCDTLMLYRKCTGTCKSEDRNTPFANGRMRARARPGRAAMRYWGRLSYRNEACDGRATVVPVGAGVRCTYAL